MTIPIHNEWEPVLDRASQTESYQQLREFLKKEYFNHQVYPAMEDLWNAFDLTDYDEVKAVILGQDPYHGPNQAHGLAFSVKPGQELPPSLQNIYKELQDDLGCSIPNHGCLNAWAKEGVLLLNTVLTVRAHQAHSHRGKGWEDLTDQVIQALNQRDKPLVFILWGRAARNKKNMIDTSKHGVVESLHPSPLSAYRGFFGSRPFSKTNQFLQDHGQTPINWQIPDQPVD